jgi:hypothetical protein
MTTLEPAEDAAAAVESWNALHQVGTPVCYWPGFRTGPGTASKTRTPAWVVCGNAVVSVNGYPGGIALTHIELDKDAGQVDQQALAGGS